MGLGAFLSFVGNQTAIVSTYAVVLPLCFTAHVLVTLKRLASGFTSYAVYFYRFHHGRGLLWSKPSSLVSQFCFPSLAFMTPLHDDSQIQGRNEPNKWVPDDFLTEHATYVDGAFTSPAWAFRTFLATLLLHPTNVAPQKRLVAGERQNDFFACTENGMIKNHPYKYSSW